MRRPSLFGALFALCLALAVPPAPAPAQFGGERYVLSGAERQELAAGRDRLRAAIHSLREQAARTGAPRAEQLPDAEIYLDAVDRNLQQDLFFSIANVEQARACLQEGEARVVALAEGKAPWARQPGVVVLGYRSDLDGSAQPYQVYVPAGYDFDGHSAGRLDLFLHGRAGTLNEIAFVRSRGWLRSAYGTEQQLFLVLYPYGRANNGWRFAGERDLFESLAAVRRRFRVDPNRIVLRGFSMGGHGAWHVGLQHPGRWAAMSPGAGFVDTIQYQKMTQPLPDGQRALLHLYDPVDYAANAADLPVLADIGDQDPARGQHELMYAALRREGAPFREFLGPETPHRYEPNALQSILGELEQLRREPDAPAVEFVTYTLRWPACKWIRIEGLERHWQRAEVHPRRAAPGRVTIATKNVTALRVTPAAGASERELEVGIDGQTVRATDLQPGAPLALVRADGRWSRGEPKGLRKQPGLQGPIDDALFGPLVAVAGTGTPWSEPLDRWTRRELDRFRQGWASTSAAPCRSGRTRR